VKSTGLYLTDPVLKERGVKTDYWKTGHSYIKRRTAELKALAGFEKSGHFFSIRRSAMAMMTASSPASPCWKCWTAPGAKKLSALYDGLPKTWGSPTMSPFCRTTRNMPWWTR